ETWKRVENSLNMCLEEILDSGKSDLKVLDVGCGEGYHLCLLDSMKDIRIKKLHLKGIDISEIDLALAEETAHMLGMSNIFFEKADIEGFCEDGKGYDIVMCIDVIEHMDEPEKCLNKISALLVPGGVAVITTPNATNILIILKRVLTGKKDIAGGSPQCYQKPGEDVYNGHSHISVIGLKEWKKLIRGSGLNIEKICRGSFLFGGYKYNRHPVLSGMIIIIDSLLDILFFFKGLSESLTFKVRKPIQR
ncbi:class I SAM-dependent methyltransferase, partial [bacterium]|nr:class I SAM-dependent methyltransferase [bacterium]